MSDDTGPLGGRAGSGSLLQVGNTLQSIAQSIISAVAALQRLTPVLTSGQLSADTLVFSGFVRVLGVSVVVKQTTPGFLCDAATIAGAVAGTEIFPLPDTAGYVGTQMIFVNGLVYKPASGEKAAFFFTRS